MYEPAPHLYVRLSSPPRPSYATVPLFEAFAKNIVDTVQANPKLWSTTAILITFDESGGEFDSGYIQPIDFFGDGPRTLLLAVSPFAKFDFADHTYTDHVSILKFIEWNWKLKPLSKCSLKLSGPTGHQWCKPLHR
jgi:phospholipase C